MPLDYLFIPLIGLLAFFLKGTAGTGTSTVIVALSSLVIPAKETVILAAFVNIFGGLFMWRIDPLPIRKRYWIPISAAMIIGSVIGALMLKVISPQRFQAILGTAFLLTGVWFFRRAGASVRTDATPAAAGPGDLSVGLFSGICGGFIGICAPPLVLHFGRYLDKARLRRLLVIIFIPAAVAQTGTFALTGQLTREILLLGLVTLPTIPIGISLGNRVFLRMSETGFRRTLGGLLVFIALRLIFKSLG